MTTYKMVDFEGVPYIYAERICSMDPTEIRENMGIAFGTVGEFVREKGITDLGKALAVYPVHDEKTLTFRAGYIVSADDAEKAEGAVKSDALPSRKMLNYVHRGPYSELQGSYAEMVKHVAENNMVIGLPNWEIYLNNPDSVASEDELETDIYVTVSAARSLPEKDQR